MAFSKADLFNEEQKVLAHFCKAISHPARICILNLLAQNGVCTVNELSRGLPVSPSTMAQHLEILRKKELIHCREEFPYTLYWPNEPMIQKLTNALGVFGQNLLQQIFRE